MKRTKVAAAYNHAKYLKQRTAMMQWWADYLDEQLPLSRQGMDVLRALKLLTGNGRLVFPGANDKKKPMSNNTILYGL